MSAGGQSRQARKTRAAVLGAFRELALRRGYADIRVGDIIRLADVGRSTFYEHFRDKDDVLRQSLSGLLAVLAAAVGGGAERGRLAFVLDHFRENGRLARGLVNGPSSPQVVAALAGLVEGRLAVLAQGVAAPPVPLDLAAAQIAEGQIGLVRAWLNRGTPCPAAAVATALERTATAAARALF